MTLEVNDPLLRCDVELCVNALSAHSVGHVELVVTERNGDPDLFCVSEVAHRDLVQIDTESDCASHGVAHTIDLDDSVLGEDDVVAALLAGAVAGKIYDCLA